MQKLIELFCLILTHFLNEYNLNYYPDLKNKQYTTRKTIPKQNTCFKIRTSNQQGYLVTELCLAPLRTYPRCLFCN